MKVFNVACHKNSAVFTQVFTITVIHLLIITDLVVICLVAAAACQVHVDWRRARRRAGSRQGGAAAAGKGLRGLCGGGEGGKQGCVVCVGGSLLPPSD